MSRPPVVAGWEVGLTLQDVFQGQCPETPTPGSHLSPGCFFLCFTSMETPCSSCLLPSRNLETDLNLETDSAFRQAQLESQLCPLPAV